MKKQIIRLFLLSTCLFLLFGCNHNAEQLNETKQKVKISEMKSFSKENENRNIVITESDEIEIVKAAINSAQKLPGIVNMADPPYKIEIEEESYFLWLSKGDGSIMDVKDTHTLYILSNESVTQLNELLTNNVGDF